MKPETAKRLLDWWARGADVAPGTLKAAISALVKGRPNPFVEGCIKRREVLEGRRSG